MFFYELIRYIRCNFHWKTLNFKVLLRSGSKICLSSKPWIVYKSIKPIKGYEHKCGEERISEMALRLYSYMPVSIMCPTISVWQYWITAFAEQILFFDRHSKQIAAFITFCSRKYLIQLILKCPKIDEKRPEKFCIFWIGNNM